jgi:hypothetical protein
MRHDGRHANAVEAAVEALQMLPQPERTRAVYRHHFVDRVAEQEPSIERRDACLRERQESLVQQANGQGCAHANHRRMVSIRRRHQPPASTALKGCKGSVATVWPPLFTRTDPSVASTANGAMIFGCTSVAVLMSE